MCSAPVIVTVGSMNEADSGGVLCGQTGRFSHVGWHSVLSTPNTNANADLVSAVNPMGRLILNNTACLNKSRRLLFVMSAPPFPTVVIPGTLMRLQPILSLAESLLSLSLLALLFHILHETTIL